MAASLTYCKDYELHVITLPSEKRLLRLTYVQCHAIDTYDDIDKWLDTIASIVKEYRIDLVIAGDEDATELLIDHQDSLSSITTLPALPTKHSFDVARNKLKLFELMLENELSQPNAFIYRGDGNLAGLEHLDFPVLVKLQTGHSGSGIRKFASAVELEEYLLNHGSDEEVLCQEYIAGRDICISVLCKDGDITAYTIQQCLIHNPKPYAPCLSVEFLENDEVLQQASRLMAVLGWQGVAHIDMRIDESTGQVYVIEINARFWGSLLASLVAGVNFARLYCQQNLELPAEFRGYRHIQFVRIRPLLKCIVGKLRPLSPWRPWLLRTGLTLHLYRLRRWFSLRT
jgi:carbamoylphosphate synthase large subunit